MFIERNVLHVMDYERISVVVFFPLGAEEGSDIYLFLYFFGVGGFDRTLYLSWLADLTKLYDTHI